MRPVLLLILTLLAPTAISMAPFALELSGCDYVESLNQLPARLVDPLVPPEFVVPGVANVVVGMATCDARAADGREDVVTFGWADVVVVPPLALRMPGGGLHLYRFEHVAMDDLYGEAHAAFGAECRVADEASVVVSLADVHARADASGTALWDARVPAQAPGAGTLGVTHYREIGPAAGGYAYLEGDLRRPGDAGDLAGSFLSDEGSALWTIWGPAWVSPMQYAPDFAITDATIGFVPFASAPTPHETC